MSINYSPTKLVYVAGRYRDPRGAWYVKQNIRMAEDMAVELWKMGYSVICPHANTNFFDGACPDDTWLNGDLEMLSRCDLVVMMPDWDKSTGATAEHNFAISKGISVYYWPIDVNELISMLTT